MRIRDKMLRLLEQHGLWPQDAPTVFDLFAATEQGKIMEGRWSDDETDYPPSMTVVIWISLKDFTKGWLAEHQPQAWYRPAFEATDEEVKRSLEEMKALWAKNREAKT